MRFLSSAWIEESGFAKLRRERLGRARQDGGIDTHRRERRAELDAARREGVVRREYPGGLAARANAPDGILDDRRHLRMARLADVAETRRQIGRPDEDAVDALDRRDLLEPVQRLLGLDLHHQAQLLVRALGIARDPAEPCCARNPGHTADALGRIAHRRDGALRFLGALHVGDQQRLRAEIEKALDQHRVIRRGPDHGETG